MLIKELARWIGRGIVEKYKTETEQVKYLVSQLDEQQLQNYKIQYEEQKKTVLIGYLFWWGLGSHYIYVRRYWTQAIFWCTFGGLFGWYFLDLFLMYFVVDSYNRKVSFAIIEQLYDAHYANEAKKTNIFGELGETDFARTISEEPVLEKAALEKSKRAQQPTVKTFTPDS